MYNLYDMFLRVCLSGILAGAIGIERELHSKEAGFRTHFLVGLGSALVMIISKYGFYDLAGRDCIGLDPSRMAAQVVSGIGFLGAGTIILERKTVKGLTTAAGIWTTAAIGLCIGAGLYSIGIFCTFMVLLVLEVLQRMFKYQLSRMIDLSIKIEDIKNEEVANVLNNRNFAVVFYKLNKCRENEKKIYYIQCRIKIKNKESSLEVVSHLQRIEGVISIDVESVI